MIDLAKFDIRNKGGSVQLVCKCCGWEVDVGNATLGDMTRAAEGHVRQQRRCEAGSGSLSKIGRGV